MATGWIKARCSEPGMTDRIVYQRVVDDAVVSYHEEDGTQFTPSGTGSMRTLDYGTDAGGRHSATTDGPNAKPPFDTAEIDKAHAESLKSIPALSDAPPEPKPVEPPPVVPKPRPDSTDKQKP